MFYYQNHFLFTTYIPRLTSASETTYQTLSLSHSARKNADKRAPKIGFENPYIASFVKQSTKAGELLCNCNYNYKDGCHYVEISNEKQYKALVFYFTETSTDAWTGEIIYTEPKCDEYDGDGIYKAELNNENQYVISKLDNITEMFHSTDAIFNDFIDMIP